MTKHIVILFLYHDQRAIYMMARNESQGGWLLRRQPDSIHISKAWKLGHTENKYLFHVHILCILLCIDSSKREIYADMNLESIARLMQYISFAFQRGWEKYMVMYRIFKRKLHAQISKITRAFVVYYYFNEIVNFRFLSKDPMRFNGHLFKPQLYIWFICSVWIWDRNLTTVS